MSTRSPRVIVTGDLHLYYEGTNAIAVDAFLQQLRDDPPDGVILGGDIYELWRRDLFGSPWMTTPFTRTLIDLEERGVTIKYVVGNHDEWLLRHLEEDSRYPFDTMLDYRVEIGSLRFFITHGHKYELTYNAVTNDALALTDDYAGSTAAFFWQNRPLPGSTLENIALALAGPAAGLLEPGNAGVNPYRRNGIELGVRSETREDEWGLFGHTHVPYIDRDDRIANWGSMTNDQATYLEVAGGDVTLRTV